MLRSSAVFEILLEVCVVCVCTKRLIIMKIYMQRLMGLLLAFLFLCSVGMQAVCLDDTMENNA